MLLVALPHHLRRAESRLMVLIHTSGCTAQADAPPFHTASSQIFSSDTLPNFFEVPAASWFLSDSVVSALSNAKQDSCASPSECFAFSVISCQAELVQINYLVLFGLLGASDLLIRRMGRQPVACSYWAQLLRTQQGSTCLH